METIKLVCAGFGGQGVLTIGQMVAMMGMKKDMLVSWMPSYGPEMRGGTANCHVIVSEHQQSPIISQGITHLLALSQPALNKFEHQMSPQGIIICNHKMQVSAKTNKVIQLDFNQLASDLGNIKTANMVAFGALMTTMSAFSLEDGEQVIHEKLSHFIDDNIKAFFHGANLAG